MAKRIIGADRFREVYVSTRLAVCEKRDPKGFYNKARSGQLSEFTGVSSPYEAPESPDYRVDTELVDLETAVIELSKLALNS